MAWWDDLYAAAVDVVDTVADVAEDVIETVGDVAADFVETAGNGASDGLDALGTAFPIVAGFTGWVGGIVSGVANFAGAVVKGAFGIVGGVVAGLIRLVFGIVLWNGHLVIEGYVGIGSSIAGAFILLGGTLLAFLQRLVLAESKARPLTKKEREILRTVFYNSLALYNVRLVFGSSGAFGITPNPFTLGNTIYMKSTNVDTDPDVLVHECVHVWQYQNNGSRYTMDALGAQAAYGLSAYDWEAELTRGRSKWIVFNEEAQAEMIEDIWTDGTLTFDGSTTTGAGSFYRLDEVEGRFSDVHAEFVFNGTDYKDLATEAVKALRSRINARWSSSF